MSEEITNYNKGEAMNLRQKLVEIRKSIEYMQKTQRGQNSSYVDVAVLLHKVREGMNEHGVLLSPSISSSECIKISAPTKNNKEAEDFIVNMHMAYTWHDATSDEAIVVPWFATGSHMKDPSMAFGGALTYSERYFMMKYFQIPTSEDDPERFEQKVTEYINQSQVSELQELVNSKGYNVDATLQAFASKRMNIQSIWALPLDKFEEAKQILSEMEPKKEAPKE